MCRVPELGLGPFVRGVAGRVERGSAELPTFVHCIELEIERRLAVWAQQSWLRELHHALQCLETRVGGLHPPAHEFNRQEAAAYLDVRFAAPGRPGGADVVVGVLAGPDDRAVAHPAGDLERQARGGRHRGDIALGCDGITVDGSRGPYGHVLSLGHVQRVVVRIELLDLHPFDHRVEGVRPLEQQVERFLHGPQPVGARDRHGLRRPPAPRRERLRRPHRERDVVGPRGRDAHGGGGEELTARQQVGHVETPGKVRVRRLRGRAGPVNLLPVDFADPPSLRGVVRGILGVAMALSGLALVVVSIGAGHIEWRLAALVLALWGAWGFFDSLFGWVLEPLGQFVGNALTGGGMPGGTVITIQDETVMLERLVDADPPPPPHRVVLAGIRLAEIYRTHEHDAAKGEAVIARLISRYPDAPELKYVRPA